jgi:protein-tyrosine phosphatase
MLSEADLVLVMDRGQRKVVRAMAPLARGKVFLLGEWTRDEIPDPYGKDLGAFRRSLALIRDAVSSWRGKIP